MKWKRVLGVMERVSAVQINVRSVVEKEECWCFNPLINALPVTALEGPALWKLAHAVTVLDGRVFWVSNERPKEMIEDKATEKLKKRLKDMGLIVNARLIKTSYRTLRKKPLNRKRRHLRTKSKAYVLVSRPRKYINRPHPFRGDLYWPACPYYLPSG